MPLRGVGIGTMKRGNQSSSSRRLPMYYEPRTRGHRQRSPICSSTTLQYLFSAVDECAEELSCFGESISTEHGHGESTEPGSVERSSNLDVLIGRDADRYCSANEAEEEGMQAITDNSSTCLVHAPGSVFDFLKCGIGARRYMRAAE